MFKLLTQGILYSILTIEMIAILLFLDPLALLAIAGVLQLSLEFLRIWR